MVKHIYKKGEKHHKIQHYDLLIIGGGPAGLTAAIYAARYNMKVAVIAKSFGGTANLAGEIENWPGYTSSGIELARKFKEQAESFGAKFLEAEVTHVKKDLNGFVLELADKEIHGKTLIISLGTQHRKLNIEGENEFVGRGVSYCATCDGNFFRKKNVAVIGGADSAAKAALYLSELANKVYIIYRKEQIRCEPISFEKIKEKKNIEIYYFSQPKRIIGDKKVKQIEVEEKTPHEKIETFTLDVDGVFIEIGAIPAKDIINELKLDVTEDGYIITDKAMKTNVAGVFAAGDITDNFLKQVVTASAEGAVASKSAYDYLKYEYKEKK